MNTQQIEHDHFNRFKQICDDLPDGFVLHGVILNKMKPHVGFTISLDEITDEYIKQTIDNVFSRYDEWLHNIEISLDKKVTKVSYIS